jgi:hypothetical protein
MQQRRVTPGKERDLDIVVPRNQSATIAAHALLNPVGAATYHLR